MSAALALFVTSSSSQRTVAPSSLALMFIIVSLDGSAAPLLSGLLYLGYEAPFSVRAPNSFTSALPSNPVTDHAKGGVPPVQENVTSSPTQKLMLEVGVKLTTI